VLRGHLRQVGTIAGLDDRTAISGSRDGTCRIWDLDADTSHIVRPHALAVAQEVR
jgi:WD40 repeat protein